jgi:hypothetical protein
MRSRRARIVAVTAALVAMVIATALVAGAPSTSSTPLDPNSTAPDGTKALVLLLRALGAQVDTGRTLPASHGGVALVLQDQLNDADRSKLASWLQAGGRLVVADPGSPLAGVSRAASSRGLVFGQSTPLVVGDTCSIAALRNVGAVEPDGDILLRTSPGDVGCFGAGGGYLLVARDDGAGTLVDVGGPSMWVNSNLGHAGNSVLAATLLSPTPGTRVTFIGASRIGGGNKGLLSLVSPRVFEALWGVAIAFVIAMMWRARRLGKPVLETLPVELPGSGLVEATGNLLQESGQRAYAASVLRGDLRRLITDRFGADPRLPARETAEIASARTGRPVERYEAVLGGPAPAADRDLVVLARDIEDARREVMDVR